MRTKLTAVYVPQPDGWIAAYIAEVPGVNTQGRTMEEARENLADALQMIWESYRDERLAEAGPEAQTEALSLELSGLP